jgi:hypothetical protein
MKVARRIVCSYGTILAAVLAHAASADGEAADFFAYYTKLDYQQPDDTAQLGRIPVNAAAAFAGSQADEKDRKPRPPAPGTIRWGPYADLVVNLAAGRKLVFSRATGYQPSLETAAGRFPLKPLAEAQPDPLCLGSWVSLVRADPTEIVVHWQHLPDPERVVTTETIQETFFIFPSGELRREVRVGTPRLDDYLDPSNLTIQRVQLTADGISEISFSPARLSNQAPPPLASAAVRTAPGTRPAAWLTFDDGLRPTGRDEAVESVSSAACPVAGNKTLWKKGVSGTALAFDGYFSKVTIPRARAPKITDALTLEAWVALGAYPWNDAGVVHCSAGEPIGPEDYKHGIRDPYTYRPWKMQGVLLGVDPYGRPIFKANGMQVGGGELAPEQTVKPADALPTYRWAHLAATYGGGKMSLYLDGRLLDSKSAAGPIELPDRDLLIGLNGDAERVSDPVSHSKRAANNNMPLVYGIEGLIDEVMIHDRALSAAEVADSFRRFQPPPAERDAPDLDRRILPGTVDGRPAETFGATCQTLRYHELWDNLWRPGPYRDIVVRFDQNPCRVVFWQGINSGSGWVTGNNKWMADQSWEIGGPHGCAEHMADKRGRFNHVRLIENTSARVVVHWRYASIDVGYVFPRTDVWADEYYTIYPDGSGVRFVDGIDGGWQDTQFLSQPGTTCLDNIELTAISVANTRGESRDVTWRPPNHVPPNPLADACIKRINFKSDWKVFAIHPEGVRFGTWGAGEQSKHTPDPFAGPWNHWPVGLNPSDGRFAVSTDRVTHAALGAADHSGEFILYGFTRKPAGDLAALARSWHHPPPVDMAAGCEAHGYAQSRRAYQLASTGGPLSFTLRGSRESPVVNPCFEIADWSAGPRCRVRVGGRDLPPGKTFRQGLVHDTHGKPMMVVFLEMEATDDVEVHMGL